MIYRDAKISDSNILDSLLTKLIEDEKSYDNNVELVNVKDFYINYINDNTKHFIVVEEDDNIIGYTYLIKEEDNLKIDALYIEDDKRNIGIATHLIELVIKYAKDNNFESISVNVLENNIKAKNLYSKYFKLYKKNGIKEELKMYL